MRKNSDNNFQKKNSSFNRKSIDFSKDKIQCLTEVKKQELISPITRKCYAAVIKSPEY